MSDAGTTTIAPAADQALVPLSASQRDQAGIEAQTFVDDLLSKDLREPAFKARLDQAFRLGREQASQVAGLMIGRFASRVGAGVEDTPAYEALIQMRDQLSALDPARQGDLTAPNRLLGFIPYGNKLQTYFKQFEAASAPLQRTLRQLYAARDDMERDEAELDTLRNRLWDGMQQLAIATEKARQLDARLSRLIDGLRSSDPQRAGVIEQDVLYYVRQNVQDMLTQQVVSLQGIAALDVLKKTAREVQNGCTRVATTGMSALAVAQVVARATGNQIKVMDMLQGTSASVENLMTQSSKQLADHAKNTAKMSSGTIIGLEKMQQAFNDTFKAMDAMTTARSTSLEQMQASNAALREQLERAEAYVRDAKAAP